MKDSKWLESMIAKHGSEEKVREFMREASNKSSRNKAGTGGFNYLQRNKPELLKEIAIKGGKTSRRSSANRKV